MTEAQEGVCLQQEASLGGNTGQGLEYESESASEAVRGTQLMQRPWGVSCRSQQVGQEEVLVGVSGSGCRAALLEDWHRSCLQRLRASGQCLGGGGARGGLLLELARPEAESRQENSGFGEGSGVGMPFLLSAPC